MISPRCFAWNVTVTMGSYAWLLFFENVENTLIFQYFEAKIINWYILYLISISYSMLRSHDVHVVLMPWCHDAKQTFLLQRNLVSRTNHDHLVSINNDVWSDNHKRSNNNNKRLLSRQYKAWSIQFTKNKMKTYIQNHTQFEAFCKD